MQKRLTIMIDERVYEGLYKVVGRRNIRQFIEGLVRPHVLLTDLRRARRSAPAGNAAESVLSKHSATNLEAGYRAMAADEAHEAKALEWSEATIGDITNAT
ncbi:MAG: addiction module antitoxin [Anaerolineae bacterium]|nr:addiction module antitoxin [Candidatus Roseilinea sp.]MDW8450844.1 addiction module antitoxin [Anaerolineae bacterium]